MIVESSWAFHHLHIIIARLTLLTELLATSYSQEVTDWILRIYLFIHCRNIKGWCKLEIVAQDSAEVFGKIL